VEISFRAKLAPGALLLAFLHAASAEEVKMSGSIRSRLEAWAWFPANGNHTYAFSGNLARLSFAQTTRRLDWQLDFAAPFLLGLPAGAVAPPPQLQLGVGGNYFAANHNRRNATMVFPKQAFLRWKGLFGDSNQSLRLGRFEWMDGAEAVPADSTLAAMKRDRINQRLIGPFGWTHVGRSFDGFHYVASKAKLTYTVLGALPTRGVFQTDGWGNLKVGFLYASLNRQLGAGKSAGEWRALAIYYHDWRRILKTDNRPLLARQLDLANLRIGTYGGHYIHKLETSSGAWNLLLWGVVQHGRWGRLNHAASAINLEGGWQPPGLGRWKPWFNGGFSRASGDANPTDGKHNTFFQLLPTPRPFARFPFYDMFNNEDFFGMLTVRPHQAVTLRGEYHALRLTSRNDLWYLGGGAFQPWSFGYIGRNTAGARSLANQWDASVDWTVNPQLNLNLYLGYAQSKAAVASIYPAASRGMLGYLEATYRF
jgi:hypothetical protein